MNALDHYLKTKNLTNGAFAQRIGKSGVFVRSMRLGEKLPSIQTALVIERETGGAVPVQAWAASETEQ